ncbi:MAG: sigma-54 dependent transcriptional regulator [Deferrisomatales bacterium]|nr:sigma-54 dependent transcriptional regulator [Deferrisomatales bacterium]
MKEVAGPRVLVVDDDVRLLEALVKALRSMGYDAEGEADPRLGLDRVRAWGPDAVITDMKMPGLSGADLAEQAQVLQPELPVLVLTGYGTIRSAVEAMRRGVYDYLTKPFDLDEVDLALRKALEHRDLRRENRLLAEALGRVGEAEGLVGTSLGMRELRARIAAVAATDSTVLVTGESGTGKELVSRAIHAGGPRRDRPFVTVDCAGLPAALLESELFGHARGSFTGAHRERAGYFEVASDGTVFLDEIGELELSLQKKLLRVIEGRTFARVGESQRRSTRARVVAATNRDLEAEVRAGHFREDLFYRLQVIEIRVPPLRERLEDLPLLVSHHLERLNRRLNRRAERVTPPALGRLRAHSWPGNVRELVNLLESILTFHDVRAVGVEQLPSHMGEALSPGLPPGTYPELKARVLEEATRPYLAALLTHYRGNVTRVAEHAGLDRRHIHRLLSSLDLDPNTFREN